MKQNFKNKKLKYLFLFAVVFCFIAFINNIQNSIAATFDLSPSSKEFVVGCQRSINIEIDSTGEYSNAADIEIHYDPTKIDIVDSLGSMSGTQIKPGNAYEVYIYNEVDESSGIIKLAGSSFISEVTTRKVFGTIEFISLTGTESADFDVRFDGLGITLDSNVAETSSSNDILTSVTNGHYTFKAGSCENDNQSPKVNFLNPQDGQSNVSLNSNLDIQITDNQSGVNVSTLVFDVNGVYYEASDPQITFSGDPSNYRFIINPSDDFPSDQPITIRVSGEDNSGNKFNTSIVFNISDNNVTVIYKQTECRECEICQRCANGDESACEECDGKCGPEPPESPEPPVECARDCEDLECEKCEKINCSSLWFILLIEAIAFLLISIMVDKKILVDKEEIKYIVFSGIVFIAIFSQIIHIINCSQKLVFDWYLIVNILLTILSLVWFYIKDKKI